MSKTIVVFGGDGFCGWPTSLRLSEEGYDVIIVDNLIRRKIDIELECESLTPIKSIGRRIDVWKELSGREIRFEYIDVSKHYHRIYSLLKNVKPTAVIHFAEQRSAPFSMKSQYHKRYTVNNNLNATHNILCAIVESGLDIHMIHLGTTGVYGYGTSGMDIPEGYLKVKVDVEDGEKEFEIMYPPNPGSIYHMTKAQDAMMFYFFNRNDGLKITDLHQGIVWGTETSETMRDERLVNRFDYDGDYGTVLNRFIMQAAVGHPLTVHGSGEQTRAFINIKDTVNCIILAVEHPPKEGEKVKIFNQTTECHKIHYLAEKVSKISGSEMRYYKNPRKEEPKNDLRFCQTSFHDLGLQPITLNDGLISEINEIAMKYKDRCDISKIICKSTWTADMMVDHYGSKDP